MRLTSTSILVAVGLTLLSAAPAAVAQGPPDMSGPLVVRFDASYAVTWVDPARGTRVVVGADMIEFCNGIIDFNDVEIQEVTPSTGNVHRNVSGDNMETSVWPFLPFDCGLFLNMDPLATGPTKLKNTDNDTFFNGVGGNAWGWTAQGNNLSSPNGERQHVAAHLRCRIDGQGDFVGCTSQINLH